MNTDPTANPDFTVFFPGGTYGEAICGYRDAQFWALDMGLVFGNLGRLAVRILRSLRVQSLVRHTLNGR